MARRALYSEAFSVRHLHEDGANRGPWRIVHRTVDADTAKAGALRAYVTGSGRYTPPGAYVGLFRGQSIVMSDTPDEMRDHLAPYLEAKRRGGRVLLHGLGLGMLLHAVLQLPQVEHVDVVEVDADVIALCGPPLERLAGDRLTIHHDDAFTRQWPVGVRWQVVWHDVWDVLCADNLADEEYAVPGTYARLNRRFGRRADWQGAWGQELLQADRRRWA